MQSGNTLYFEDYASRSVANLFTFLKDKELRKGMENVEIIVQGIHPSPLDAEQMKWKLKKHFAHKSTLDREYVDKMLMVTTHRERTRMAKLYNTMLERECKRNNVHFVEVLTDTVDGETGIVNERFVKSKTDVHLDSEALIPIYHRKFKEMNLEFARNIDSVWDNARKYRSELKDRFT